MLTFREEKLPDVPYHPDHMQDFLYYIEAHGFKVFLGGITLLAVVFLLYTYGKLIYDILYEMRFTALYLGGTGILLVVSTLFLKMSLEERFFALIFGLLCVWAAASEYQKSKSGSK